MFETSQTRAIFSLPGVLNKRHAKPLAAAMFLTAISVFGFVSQAEAATVDCSRASTPSEFAICNSEDLQQLDNELSNRFSRLIHNASTIPVQQVMKREMNNFLVNRNKCGADMICLQLKYENELHKSKTMV